MRIVSWTIAVLLGFSAAAQAKPPLCNDEDAGKIVRIDVIVDEKRVEPKECTVAPGTKVIWFMEDGDKEYEADFGKGKPGTGDETKFKSKKVLWHQEARMTAREVEEATTFDYALIVEGEAYDPAIIIDPGK
jgi:plastocyanin